MSIYNENLANRILESLNYPVIERCTELSVLFERCSLRELQEIFPAVINSIFGINSGCLGWGLRTINKEKSSYPQVFDTLYNFFTPLGPMFRLCYRLLNDAIKFEFNIEMLPHKLTEMLQSGHYSMFYADLLNIDPFHRCINSLSLNAFDYYMINFIIHGTFPLHKMYPAALEVHNDRVKTIYFFLTAEYLCSFLPSNPDAIVMPSNICGTVKAPQPMPVQQLQPTRSPKYLKLGPISHYNAANQSAAAVIRSPESPRAHCWRSESVMYLFIDGWLRYDIEEAMELPSSEFIRVVRILVKQLHAFGNSAEIDPTPMSALRKMAQPMMKQRIYPFLKSIIARWPLDSSMSVVLELWLSYIQPWRYTFDRSISGPVPTDFPISKYDGFIAENLAIYTQIFVQILPRFERLDFTSFRNAVMLHRLIKVFNQSALPEMLNDCERRYTSAKFPMSPHQTSPIRQSPYLTRPRTESQREWDSFRSEHYVADDIYIPLFGDNIKGEIYQLIKTVCVAKMYVQQEMCKINYQINEKNSKHGFIKRLILSFFEDITPEQSKLQEIKKIPDILSVALSSLSNMFEVDMPNVCVDHSDLGEANFSSTMNFTLGDDSDYFDASKISPLQMKRNIANIKANVDPALLPIQSSENSFLVRSLHQVSSKVNENFGGEIQKLWDRKDFWGKLTRQIIYPPITIQWFDKSKGISELHEDCLAPRLCLRLFGSYKTIFTLILACIIGKIFWNSYVFGIILLGLLSLLYLFISALLP
ncbi:sphingomyelin phosphodiesterase 4 [Condylostylus longicornis]|uniref:sphingomyelin phosphodiesterase 4 n=1 Tax=Condylostylus longicornis TaxID=2530218 RepID=UPI00244DB65B|nr:sphingomyelin phosphodiesterase 4 [Condylostylus longicornis]